MKILLTTDANARVTALRNIEEPRIPQSLLGNRLGSMIFRLWETASSGAGLCFGDYWRAFLVEMKSSAYGNLGRKVLLSPLVVVSISVHRNVARVHEA